MHAIALRGGLTALLVLLTACAGVANRRLVDTIAGAPPLRADVVRTDMLLRTLHAPRQTLSRADAHDLSYAVLEPGAYRLETVYLALGDAAHFSVDARSPTRRDPARHGTVVLVHGWGMDLSMMLPWAVSFANRGFRAVLVDLRNHGASGAALPGYGSREAQDVLDVVDALEDEHRLAQPYYLFGVSLGAVTAIHAAARTPHRFAAVAALEPFANAARAVVSMQRFAATAPFGGAAARVGQWLMRWLVSADDVEAAIDAASQRLTLDLRALETAEPLAMTQACVLLVHGRRDTIIPIDESRALARAVPRTQMIELLKDGHFSTPLRLDLLADGIADWYVANAARDVDGGCVAAAVPPRDPPTPPSEAIPEAYRDRVTPPGGAVAGPAAD